MTAEAKAVKLDGCERYTRLFSAKNGNAVSFRSGHVVLKENENIGEHSTGASEEMLVILEGEGELSVKESEKIDFKKDTVLYVPPNTAHDVKNTGERPLKYIFITSPI